MLRTTFHVASSLTFFLSFWYDQCLDIPHLQWKTDTFLRGRLKFLTLWDLNCVGSKPIKNMSVRVVCHFFAVVHFWYGCYYDWNYVKIPLDVSRMGESFGFSGKLKFLTFWDALLQGFFFAICLLNDIIGTNENVPKRTPLIRKIKDLLLVSLAFPLAQFVALTFWGLYFVDRELIFPKALDPYFPTWLNHVMHTNIAIFILIELFTSFRKYPTRKQGISILGIFMIVYLVWIHIIYSYSGMWVYPILEVLNLPLRIVFFIGLFGLIYSLYIVGEKLNSLIWKKQLKALKIS